MTEHRLADMLGIDPTGLPLILMACLLGLLVWIGISSR